MTPARSLADALRDAPMPGADEASVRAWAVLADAHAARRPVARFRRRGRVVALAFATVLMVAAVSVAAEPPRWVQHALGTARPAAPPARVSMGSLPAGRLLVSSARGMWIVRGDGTRLRLGPWTAATWSPQGLYLAAWRGRELSAVAPDGRIVWTLAAPAPVQDARWSPDGYRIAYRRAGGLAVVAGDGTNPHALAARVSPVAPAWRPGERHTLAWVTPRGIVDVRDVDTGRVAWRSRASIGAVRELSWSADGRRLLARGPHRLAIADLATSHVHHIPTPPATTITAAAWAPRGQRLAVALREGTDARIAITTTPRLPHRATFTTTGTLTSLAWSPDASRLLVRWNDSDLWLLIPPTPTTRITAIPGISRRFGGPPSVQGWCCS